METSKKELQSINEQLQTVNTELKLKLEAVSRGHSDLQNLMAAADFGTLFLDAGLRIKRFTQQVTELISITPHDEGRPVSDFAHRLEYDDLVEDAQAVLSHLAPITREVRGGRWYDIRLQLEAYMVGSDRLRIEGDAVVLPPDLASPFGVVLYELATNAAKYGALSQPTGRVFLNCRSQPGTRSSF